MIEKLTGNLTPNRFIAIDTEEHTVLEQLGKIVPKVNEVVEKTNTLEENVSDKVSKSEMVSKHKMVGENFNGSWHGIEHPSLADETIGSVVKVHDETFNSFINNVSVVKTRLHNTDICITTIPTHDTDGEKNKINLGYASDTINVKSETAREFNTRHNTSVLVNGGVFEQSQNNRSMFISIQNGVLKYHNQTDINNYLNKRSILAIMQDDKLKEYPLTTDPNILLSEGVKHALVGFFAFVKDGGKNDTYKPNYSEWSNPHPRQMIGQRTNGDIVIISSAGRRSPYNVGLTIDQLQDIAISQGCVFAYGLDWGGSTQTLVNGVQQIEQYDNNYKDERAVSDFLYWKKEHAKKDILQSLQQQVALLTKRIDTLKFESENHSGLVSLQVPPNMKDLAGIEVWEDGVKHSKLLMKNKELALYSFELGKSLFKLKEDGLTFANGQVNGNFYKSARKPSELGMVENLNNITENGIYWSTTSVTNNPDNAMSYAIIHIGYGGTAIQMGIGFSTTTTIKTRRLNSGTWGAWN